MDSLVAVIGIILCVFIFIVLLLALIYPVIIITQISTHELDESNVFEMRKQGYTEEEIKEVYL